jgi:NADH-quinone oxidoreductase subunit D
VAIRTEPFVLNMGPVHPSTHGVYRMRLTLDGEVIVDIEPVVGYLHRGIEKLAEERTWTGVIPLTDRLDYVSSMSNNLAYCLAVEKLAGITVPERAEYLRVIMSAVSDLPTII